MSFFCIYNILDKTIYIDDMNNLQMSIDDKILLGKKRLMMN